MSAKREKNPTSLARNWVFCAESWSHSPLRVVVYLLPEQKLAKTEVFVNLCWRQKKTPQSRNFRGGRLGALTNAADALWNIGPSQRRAALDLERVYGRYGLGF